MCDTSCENMINSGEHICEKGCNSGESGLCRYQGKKSCPCSKKFYPDLSSDVEAPLCGGICDKVLDCGDHRCTERYHRGPCLETCRIVVTKSCRCGGTKKQICGRRLGCKNHKCQSSSTQDPCPPCPKMVTISCACDETQFKVPCGTETNQKSPSCSKLCQVTPLCTHGQILKPHKCHYGACPQCLLPCDEEYPCGHKCKLSCHGPRPTKKMMNIQAESTPCPPCPELVRKHCVGYYHVTSEKEMVCSEVAEFTCDQLCGYPLPCGKHYCSFPCHAMELEISSWDKSSEFCEKCDLSCQKRIPGVQEATESASFLQILLKNI